MDGFDFETGNNKFRKDRRVHGPLSGGKYAGHISKGGQGRKPRVTGAMDVIKSSRLCLYSLNANLSWLAIMDGEPLHIRYEEGPRSFFAMVDRTGQKSFEPLEPFEHISRYIHRLTSARPPSMGRGLFASRRKKP